MGVRNWLIRTNPGSQNFSLIWMLEISILGASICIGRKITYFIRASENGEINKGKSSIIGDETINIEGRAASFLLPQKLREDDDASKQKLRAKKVMIGQCKIYTLGQRGGKYVGGNKTSKSSKMEAHELSTKFCWTLSNCTINSA